MRRWSELKIIVSQCLSGGTAWNEISSTIMQDLRTELQNISGLEFKRVQSNTVRGEHNSFTIILSGVFYNLSQTQGRTSMSKLLEYTRNAVNKIVDLSYAEIRIEHTRNMAQFTDYEHQAMVKPV